MSLLRRRTETSETRDQGNPLEIPSVSLSSATVDTFDDWAGRGNSRRRTPHVSENRALGISAYYRGLSLNSGTLAGIPWKVYKDTTRERVRQKTILDRPNPQQTTFEWFQTQAAQAQGWGNCYSRIVRDGTYTPRQVWPIHPSLVRTEQVEPSDANPAGLLYLVQTKTGEVRRTQDDIFHVPHLAINGVQGVSPLQVANQVLGIAVAVDDTAGGFFASGSRISGVLSVQNELVDGEADYIKAEWKKRNTGPDAAGDIVVLPKSTTFSPIAIPPGDAQLLTSRQFSVAEIARLLGIPPHMLGDVTGSTSWGSGIEQQTIGYVTYSLMPWIKLFEQRITAQLLPGGWTSGAWRCEADLAGLLRGDFASRVSGYGQAIRDGWLSRDEVRAMENREAIPNQGGETFLVPSNMTLISVDGSVVPLSTKGVANATQ
jgi:HK97 family phage portal protein